MTDIARADRLKRGQTRAGQWAFAATGVVLVMVLAGVAGCDLAAAIAPSARSGQLPMALSGGVDQARLAAPLSLIQQARQERVFATQAQSGVETDPQSHLASALSPGSAPDPAAGTLRYRHRFLSWHVLTPLQWQGTRIIDGSLVVVEDNDDESTSAIVYEFAGDGTVIARSPWGRALGTLDLTTNAAREALREAARSRMLTSTQ